MEVEEGSQEWDSRYYHAYMEGQELFDSRIAASAYRDSPSATTRLTRPSRIHTHLTHPPRTHSSLTLYLSMHASRLPTTRVQGASTIYL